MTLMQMVKPGRAVAAIVLLSFGGISITSPRVHASSSESDSRVQNGFAIAPVKLDLKGKNPAMVGRAAIS